MKDSKIEWTHHTFNPWIGCTKVSTGCQHCYAEALMDKRWGKVEWGPRGERQRTSESYWKQPLSWNRKAKADGVRYRVFCASLADVFEDNPQVQDWRVDLWDMIKATPYLDWLLLTKRPENVRPMTRFTFREDGKYKLPMNVWIGASVENQDTANERIPALMALPAYIRFLSMEPLLGPVDLWSAQSPSNGGFAVTTWGGGVDWVIVGGESGHGSRPLNPAWVRAIRDECAAASVPFFFKQWGDLRPIEHSSGNVGYERMGKKYTGRELDRKEYNEFPSACSPRA